MRPRHATSVALGTLAVGVPAAAASGPTASQIQKAVRTAESSPDLWATVNLCDTRRHPHELGLRGQMPGLGFSSNLYMTFEVYYRSGSHFRPDPRTKERMSLGSHSGSSLHQAGVTFAFASPAVLEAKVVFTWKLGGRRIGHFARLTTGHHKHVDFGDPRGYSAASCTIR